MPPVINPEIKTDATRIKEGILKTRSGGTSDNPQAAGTKHPIAKAVPPSKTANGTQDPVLCLGSMNDPNQREARKIPRNPASFSGVIKILERYVRKAVMEIFNISKIPGGAWYKACRFALPGEATTMINEVNAPSMPPRRKEKDRSGQVGFLVKSL